MILVMFFFLELGISRRLYWFECNDVSGWLLLDKHLEGQLYVKKVWVADYKKDDIATGVDFIDLHVDRYVINLKYVLNTWFRMEMIMFSKVGKWVVYNLLINVN